MEQHAKGDFDVKVIPQSWSDSSTAHGLGRFMLNKQYHGDLDATSEGQMLAAGDGKPGSSGVYVAIEKITGKLQGREGSFALYHVGVMSKGAPTMDIRVVPDSGTGELQGLGGTLAILIADGKHSYDFAYTLATVE